MADTIVNTPSRRTGDTSDNAVGWVIAAIIILALIIGFFAIFRNNSVAPSTTAPAANVQTTIPNTGAGGTTGGTDTSGSGGSTGGATGNTGSGY